MPGMMHISRHQINELQETLLHHQMECRALQREVEESKLTSEALQQGYAQEVSQLQKEVAQQGLAKLDNEQAIQNLEMLAESQEELGSMLEEQAARQQQVRRRSHTMEELREEFQQQGTALQDLSQKVGFYQQGLVSEEAVLERAEVELAEWQEEYQSAHKKANRSSELEEQATLTYQVELLAAQDDIRKLKKSLVDVSLQRSETAAKQREEAQQVRHTEQELAARASQLEMRCKAQEHQLEIARQLRKKSEVEESEDLKGSSLENMCERIRGDCYRELESIELSTALAQQEAFELKEAQLQMEIKHDVLLEEVGQWRSEGPDTHTYSLV
eukprot:s23_g21.t2